MKARALVVAALVLCNVVMGRGLVQRPSLGALLSQFRQNLPPRMTPQNPGSGNPFPALPKPPPAQSAGNSNPFMAPVNMPTVHSFSWSRTLGGVNVKEEASYTNASQLSMMTVKSRDSQLQSLGFTAATTVYIFGADGTSVFVKAGSGSPPGPPQGFPPKPTGPGCFVLPQRSISLAQASEQLRTRNNTTISAPATVEKFRATGKALDFRMRMQVYMQHPLLFVLCGLSELRKAESLTAGASFPVTATGKVLRMVSLDTELQILVS